MDERVGLALLRTEFQTTTGLVVDAWHDGNEAEPTDVRLRAGGTWFAAEFKAAANTEQIGAAIRQLQGARDTQSVPLLVVPYMGDAGRQLCHAAGVSWLDLSGNAEIEAPLLRIPILGEPNRHKRSGRPASLFASRSARAPRVFLMDVQRTWPQTELAHATGLSAGFLSRLLPRYEEAGFIECGHEGRGLRYRVTDPDALLDAWHADYDFTEHTILRGHVAARGGPELLRELSEGLARRNVDHAATGLAGAWLWEPFAAFQTVTFYLATLPGQQLLAEVGFHEGVRGSNTWLVVPADDGVFASSAERGGMRCVSPVQVYVDLKGQPERAEEAGAELRRVHLNWQRREPESEP